MRVREWFWEVWRRRSAGCDVKMGILEDECRELNKRFFTFYEKKRPYIILKWTHTADGYIGMQYENGDGRGSIQISGNESGKYRCMLFQIRECLCLGFQRLFLYRIQK